MLVHDFASPHIQDASSINHFHRTFEQRQDNLTEVFGSKNKKKAMIARQRNKTSNVAESVAKHVQQLVETKGISGKEMVINEIENSLLLMPVPINAGVCRLGAARC